MNRCVIVALLVVVAGTCVQSRRRPSGGRPGGGRPGGGRPGGGSLGGNDDCRLALSPTGTEQLHLRVAAATCIPEQAGLQTIIDGLRGGRRRDIASRLEENSYTTEATTLRQCLARETGMLNADDTFDMTSLTDGLLAKVVGLDLETNTQLGLDNCPAVVEYDVPEYLQCVMTYCRTGAAP